MKMDTWYCAGWSRELATRPMGRRLLGRHVVLFRDAEGTARAVGGRCAHRGADLAQGLVVAGRLQCPFHGWCFDGLGRCVRVPSQPDSMKISTLARLPSFPLRERQGTLWIWMNGAEVQANEPPDDACAADGRPVRRLCFDPQLLAAPFLDALESLFDKAHVPFIHAGTFGPNQNPLVARQRITVDADGRSLRAEDDADSPWRVEPKMPGGWVGYLGRLFLGLGTPRAQHTRFDVGGGVQIFIEYPKGTYDRFVTHLTPADEVHTWLFVESVRTRAPHRIGDRVQRRVIRKLFEEGERETSLLLPAGPDDPPRPVSVESDRLGLMARQLYERWARGSAASAGECDLAVSR